MNKQVSFEIENINYKIPEYISIENYVKVFKIKDLFLDEYFNIKLLNILTGAPVDKLTDVNYNTIEHLSKYATNLFPNNNCKFEDRFEFNGVKYGFIPYWKELSFGEFIDLDTLMGKKGNELLDNIHLITSILYRPITEETKKGYKIEKYNVDSMVDRADLFKELNVKYFISAQVFFYQFVTTYLNHIQLSSIPKKIQMKMIWKYRKIIWKSLFRKDLDGMELYRDYLTTTLLNNQKSQKQTWYQSLTILHSLFKKTKKKKDNMMK